MGLTHDGYDSLWDKSMSILHIQNDSNLGRPWPIYFPVLLPTFYSYKKECANDHPWYWSFMDIQDRFNFRHLGPIQPLYPILYGLIYTLILLSLIHI